MADTGFSLLDYSDEAMIDEKLAKMAKRKKTLDQRCGVCSNCNVVSKARESHERNIIKHPILKDTFERWIRTDSALLPCSKGVK